MPWTPLLDGADANRAVRAIVRIGESLRTLSDDEIRDGSVASGHGALALFHAYLASSGIVEETDAHRHIAAMRLERSIETLRKTRMPVGLYHGLAGIGWVVEHLRRGFIDGVPEDFCSPIDEALDVYLDRLPEGGDYGFDLMDGLVGLALYALEHRRVDWTPGFLERVVSRLGARGQRQPSGWTWYASADTVPPYARARYRDGCFNLGVPHGIPGVAALLAQLADAEIRPQVTGPMADDAVAWCLHRRLGLDAGAEFPSWIGADDAPPARRASWCYGNPGIAAALIRIGRLRGRPDWEEAAVDLALACADRDEAAVEGTGASICHGAAGNGHLFHRLYRASADQRLGRVARTWLRRALDLQREERGIAGYLFRETDESGQVVRSRGPGFLTGVAGVGLALIAAVSPIEPGWDRLLLASGPPPP